MAINLSEQYIQENYTGLKSLWFKLLIRCYRYRYAWRVSRLRVESGYSQHHPTAQRRIEPCTIRLATSLEKAHFREHKWVFLENFFEKNYFERLSLIDIPKHHFKPMAQTFKSYDNGLINPEYTYKRYPPISECVNFFSSPKFESWLEELAADNLARVFDRMKTTRAYRGSSCIPHVDSIAKDLVSGEENQSFNIIIFVKGTGGTKAGGTCIMRDNEYDIEFEPTNLTNSCLIYDAGQIFHGFAPMKKGKKRWMMAFNMNHTSF